MQIHQFEIDTRADEAYDTASDRYYFFYDKSKTLSAWVTRKSGDKLLIIAYQASQERNMKIVDINELANISKTIQITRNGELILGTKRGVLKLTLESAKIKIERSEAKTWRKNEIMIAQVNIARHIAFMMEFTNFGLLSQPGTNLTIAV